jgi:putative redox protein
MPVTPAKKNTVTVVVEEGALAATIQAGGHRLIVDEPTDGGGLDSGPTPYDYLLSALGSCTAITMRLYANLKKWPLGRIEVELSHERVHAADCANCDLPDARLDRIHKTIRVTGGDLTPEQLQRLEVISARCPVQKTLAGGIAITTSFTR